MEEIFDLAQFDQYKEDNRREVKAANGGLPQNLWETYSAMANTYGGVIICGVKERADGSWFTTGMKNIVQLQKDFWNQINDPKKVSINLLRESDVKSYEKDGDVILVIHVPSADRQYKPVFINGDLYRGSFKRNNEGDYHCTHDEVQGMLRDQTRVTMDMKVLPNMSIGDFDRESVKSYRTWFAIKHPDHAWTKLPDDQFLEMIGAASDDCPDHQLHPTCAGLLMFGQEHKITREYPMYFLDYRDHADPSVRWTDRIQSQSPDWSGNLFDFFTQVSRKLLRLLKVPFKLVNMVRVDETPMHDAVREALVNCLVNADYFLPRGVVIDSYDDRIVLKNPGTSIVGKRQMLRGGDSEPRNANVMKMFNLLGFGEHAGSGIPDIYSVWETAGYIAPTIEEHFGEDGPSKMVITLPLVENEKTLAVSEKSPEKSPETKKSDVMQQRMQKTIDLLRLKPTMTRAELSVQLNITESQAKTVLEKLRTSGRIHREGSDTKGMWIVED